MSATERLRQFFHAEALEHCEQLGRRLAPEVVPGRDVQDAMLASVRVLRGGATMARLTSLAVLAGQLERVLKSVAAGRLVWTPLLVETLRDAVTDLGELAARLPGWGPAEDQRAHIRSAALARYAAPPRNPEGERVVPIASLFHSDPGPHILYVAVTPHTQFEDRLRGLSPLARAAAAVQPEPEPPGSAVQQPAREAARRAPGAPRGGELRDLLAFSVARIDASFASSGGDEVVPIESLLYSGRSAWDRARELARSVHAAGAPVPPETLSELIDIIELAARG